MDKLNKDWLTERCVDFEYKKYMLLAYLQHVDSCYRLNKLYPPLADLIEHYRTAKLLKESKQNLSDAFPQRLQGFDDEKFRLTYDKVISDDALMREMENILDFSLPRFEEYVQEGRAIFEYMEREMVIRPVGISPLDPNSGYLFLKDLRAETRVYEYTITIFEQPGSRYRAIHTTYVKTYRRSITKTFNWIKEQLICKNPALPNPAVFAVESGLDIPVEETFLPIAKRLLVREVEAGKQ
ncbi:MAG: hypothetical protein FD123_536 [Bacteroidetes bacterium]|nr:MAG: hypothetical protein FD123_536 [Bacteroidota bacterium]